MDLRNVLLLDNQSTFDLYYNKKFTSKITKATNALTMMSNGGSLRITEKCKIPGYKYPVWYSKKAIINIICLKNLIKCFTKATNALTMTSNGGSLRITEKCKISGYKYPVWYSKRAITNIICLKNLIKCYRVTYDSELNTTFIVHCSAFGLPDLLFEMHPCGLHVCCSKKMGQFGFVQTVHDNIKLVVVCQISLALDTGHTITWHQWVVLPMPPAVIARVNLLGEVEPSILTFTDRHGRDIGDYPRDLEPVEDDDASFVDHFNDVLPAVEVQDDTEIPGVVTEPVVKPTGVKVDPANNAPQENYFDDGPGQQDEALPPTQIPPTLSEDPAPPSQGMAARNTRVRKPPKKYVSSMKGNKYAVAMTQIAASLKDSKHAMAMAQMSVKLMSPGIHR